MLLAIVQVYSYLGATDFALLSVSEISLEYQKILWLKTLCQLQGYDQHLVGSKHWSRQHEQEQAKLASLAWCGGFLAPIN